MTQGQPGPNGMSGQVGARVSDLQREAIMAMVDAIRPQTNWSAVIIDAILIAGAIFTNHHWLFLLTLLTGPYRK